MQCPLECRVQINPLHLFVEMRMDLETVIQSAVNKKENNKYHIILLICGILKNDIDELPCKAETETQM